MEVLILLFVAVITNVIPYNFAEDPDATHSCEVGDTIQNGRITCTCTQHQVYECIYKKSYELERDEISHNKLACQPNKMYVEESTTCICSSNGSWPNSACGDVFDSLPTENVVKNTCEPDGYVFVGCNVCRCDSNGYIDNTRCTNNECKSPDKRRSLKNAGKRIYGNCEARNWYSLAPCQFCFCLNENKLVCNTGNYNTQKLQLGTYNLNVCGKDLIREAIELIPDSEKSLRDREGNKNTKTSKPSTPNTLDIKSSNVQMQVKVSQEDKTSQENDMDKLNKKYEEKVSKESSSESVNKEDFGINNEEDIIIKSTKSPNQDDVDGELTDVESKEPTHSKKEDEEDRNEEDRNTDNEIVKPGLKLPVYPSPGKQKKPKRESLKTFQDLGEQLQASFPMMLDKVFQMALRKSMVTVVNDNKCVPGSVHTVKCNTCFCLKNSKMVCTDNKCVKESKK